MRMKSIEFVLANKEWRLSIASGKICLFDMDGNKRRCCPLNDTTKLIIGAEFALIIFAEEVATAQAKGLEEIDWTARPDLVYLSRLVEVLVDQSILNSYSRR